ncbi:MAG: VOC family protein [Proteobacteria bacterium]|nr:VOC family protein [Pseudomonadota bacterium]
MLKHYATVFYVDNLTTSELFYRELLGINPEESSPTFRKFKLSNEMALGLKDKRHVMPLNTGGNGGSELVFTVTKNDQVDTLFLEWKQKGIRIEQSPTHLPFGYTFLALDPDGHPLRVVSLDKQDN